MRKSKKAEESRRSFLKKGVVASSFFIVPRYVLGGTGYTAPSDRLNIAAIGAGGKGSSDIFNASVKGRERIAALCDVDFSGSAKKSVANFPEAKLYKDLDPCISMTRYIFLSRDTLSAKILFFMRRYYLG